MVNNAKRHVRLIEAQREIAIILERQGIEFAVLKGLSQWPYYTENPQQRPQYDIDIYCPRHSLHAALAAVAVGTAAGSSPALCTLETPTLDPRLAGFTKHG